MIRRFFDYIITRRSLSEKLMKLLLKCHSKCYQLAGRYAVILNNGVHPKHHIINYEKWFLDNIESGWVVLDIGCDTGMLPSYCSKKAAYVYGVEMRPERIAVAKAEHAAANIEYIAADATAYDYQSLRPINCVTMSNVLEHIEDRVGFLKKIISQVKWAQNSPKVFLFRVPMIEREWIVLYKKEMGLDSRLDPTHYIEYTLQQFEDELRQAGIAITKTTIRHGEIYAVCEVSC